MQLETHGPPGPVDSLTVAERPVAQAAGTVGVCGLLADGHH